MSTTKSSESIAREVFTTLTVHKEGAVLFADIAALPMNLLGPELVRDLVPLFSGPKSTKLSSCSFSRALTPTISFPMST
jgi:hypothetical protein